jgi:hypothetical protein
VLVVELRQARTAGGQFRQDLRNASAPPNITQIKDEDDDEHEHDRLWLGAANDLQSICLGGSFDDVLQAAGTPLWQVFYLGREHLAPDEGF